jgi:hypothetical protein
MCKTLTEGTICSGTTTFNCKCPALQYYNNENKRCEDQKSNNISCSEQDACRIDLGLSCINNICECDSTTQFWNETTCINYFTYNTGVCLSDNECNENSTGLICKIIGRSCGCPEQVQDGGYCDCDDRYYGNEHYWNGSKCVKAGIYGDACNSSYECQQLTLLLTCDNSTRKCICSKSSYDNSTGKCIAPVTTTLTPLTCVSGWTVSGNACYKSVRINQANGFKNLNNTIISIKCNFSSSGLALSQDYGTGDAKWLYSLVCTSSNFIGYFGPVANNNCPVFDCSKNKDSDKFTTHDCGHGSSNDYHFMICKY